MIAAAVLALQVLGVPQEHVVDALRRPGEPIHQENLGSLGLPVEIEWVYGPHPDLNHCYYIKCKKGGGLHEPGQKCQAQKKVSHVPHENCIDAKFPHCYDLVCKLGNGLKKAGQQCSPDTDHTSPNGGKCLK